MEALLCFVAFLWGLATLLRPLRHQSRSPSRNLKINWMISIFSSVPKQLEYACPTPPATAPVQCHQKAYVIFVILLTTAPFSAKNLTLKNTPNQGFLYQISIAPQLLYVVL